jgi:hypothetical protein
MLRPMWQGWWDLAVELVMFIPRLLGKSTIVIISAIATYVMLTRGYHG